jgi:hypothetical protein
MYVNATGSVKARSVPSINLVPGFPRPTHVFEARGLPAVKLARAPTLLGQIMRNIVNSNALLSAVIPGIF